MLYIRCNMYVVNNHYGKVIFVIFGSEKSEKNMFAHVIRKCNEINKKSHS